MDTQRALGSTDPGQALRTVRWVLVALVAAFGVVGLLSGSLDALGAVAGGGLAVGVAGVNAVSARLPGRLDAPGIHGWRGAALAIDAGAAFTAVALYAPDSASAAPMLLAAPVVSGALRAGYAGALGTWGAVTAAVLVWLATGRLAGPPALPDVLVLAAALLALALAAGAHVGGIAELREVARSSARQSRRRSAGVRTVIDATRRMPSLEESGVLEEAARAVRALGFDAVELASAEGEDGDWRVVLRQGLPEGSSSLAGALVVALAGQGGPVVRDDGDPAVAAAGLSGVVACSVWPGGDLVSVLVAGRREPGEITVEQRECVELLAGQVAVALTVADQHTRQRKLGERLAQQAWSDPLTGLANRARLLEDLERSSGAPVALVLLDLDGFESINERYGQHTGDEVLRVVGRRLRRCLRPEDTLARFGGDEYAALLTGSGDPRDAVAVGRRMLGALEAPVTVAGHRFEVSASIGIAYDASGLAGAEALLRDADEAMDRAKGDVHTSIRLDPEVERRLDAGTLR